MGSGHRRLLLAALLPLLLPEAWGDCGPLPSISHAEPPEGTEQQETFSVGSRVTYSCRKGYMKRPSLSDTIQCLPNSQWSNLPAFCGRSCPSPPRVFFARIKQEDELKNFHPVDTTVSYVCRPGYESTAAQLATSTCLDNLTWSQVPELCYRKSCGVPANPQHGRVIATDHLLHAEAVVVCDPGYTLKGLSPHVWCSLTGDEVAWSDIPMCWAISCPPPPIIANGHHNGSSLVEFTHNSVVMYTCEPGLQLLGHGTLQCVMENGIDGSWSGSPPECRAALQEKRAGSPSWLAAVIIPCGIALLTALGLLAWIILRRKGKKAHSYSMPLEMQEVNGRDPPVHPAAVNAARQLMPWQSYLCYTTSCHVSPMVKQKLHAALAPGDRGCGACEESVIALPGSPIIYSATSMDDKESWSPTATSIPAQAADVERDEDTGEAPPEQDEVNQPTDNSSSHTCPTCESWLQAHYGQAGSNPVAPRQQPRLPQQQGPQRPVCSPCADQMHLSHVHSGTGSSLVCPLAREGTPAHLVSPLSPTCHICPICKVPFHSHLCKEPKGNAEG